MSVLVAHREMGYIYAYSEMSRSMVNRSTLFDFVVKFFLIIGLSIAIIRSGQIVGTRFVTFDIPYAGQFGFILGAVFIIAIFVVLRRTYRTYWNDKFGA